MKFLIKSLIIFILLFLLAKFSIYFFNTGHTLDYNIGNFNIKETLKTKDNNYYFKVTGEEGNINFQVNNNYNKKSKVLKNLHYKKINSYNCFLPVFQNDEILTDVMCEKDNVIILAHNLNNSDINDYFKKYGYNYKKYIDNSKAKEVSNTKKIYPDNFLPNHYIAMENYKGLTLYNDNNTIEIFNTDVYKKPISIFTDKYYIVADYSEEYTFKNFIVANIINGNKKTIRSYDEISFDSYIMGAVNNDIYLFDKDSMRQYKISLKYETVEFVANKDNIKYYNGKWTTLPLKDALDGKKFENYYTDVKGYDKVDKVDNYYYLYKKNKDKYTVYRADAQNKNLITYLFETTDLDDIIYLDDAIYYQYENNFYYYSSYGSRKIITNNELEFNSDLSLGVYEK